MPEARKACSTCAALRAKNEIGAAVSAPSTESFMMPPTAARCAAAMSALSHATWSGCAGVISASTSTPASAGA